VNATERIRAALQRTEAARPTSDAPPPPPPAETEAVEPVESSLRLVSAGDPERALFEDIVAEPPPETVEDGPSRGPAATMEFLRSSLAEPVEEIRVRPSRQEAPRTTPAATEWRPAPPPAEDDSVSADLRTWAAESPGNRKRSTWIWIAVAGGVVLLAVLAVIFRGSWMPGRSAPAAATALQLAVESEDNGLISLRWNPQSQPVLQARDGKLSILQDQKPPRTVPLSAAQLASGHLFYESTSDRIEFQLEVTGKSGGVVKESAIAAKKPDPSAPSASAPAPAQTTPQTVADLTTNQPAQETPKPTQPAPKTFTPPPVAATHEQPSEGRVILMEPAPALNSGLAVPAGGIPGNRVNIIPPPPVAAPPKAAAPQPKTATAAPATQRVQVGGRLQSAMLLRKVDPAYPPLARQMRIQGLVRFQAVIGKEGEVQDLKFVSGPRVLEKAASDAIRRWVYRPTLLNGRPVEVSTQIDLDFTLGN